MHVAADDELGTGGGEPPQHLAAPAEWPFSRGAPRRCREVVVEGDDAQRARWRLEHARNRPLYGPFLHGAALLTPRAHGVQPHDDELVRLIRRLDRPEGTLPLGERPCEAGRDGVGDVVVPGHCKERGAETLEDFARPPELGAAPAVCEVARCEDEGRLHLRHQALQGCVRLLLVAAPDVQVGDVENPRGHGRGRLYTRVVANEAPELFDDVYLGLRAGGAVRKQRRGEPLSAEEEEAIGRWQRLSLWRRFIAIGAFALGTFGLGFTVGGLIFGRWRAARR